MIGALGHQDLALARGGACQRHAGRRGVGAVLAEQRPVGVRDQPDQPFGQLDQPLRRAVQAVARRHLPRDRLGHHRIAVADHDRAPAAHEVDVAPAVHVPEMAALAALEELRIALGQPVGAQVPVHAAGDDLPGTLPEFLIGCEGHGAGSANAVNWPIYTARMKACTRPGSQGSQGGNGWISRGKWPS